MTHNRTLLLLAAVMFACPMVFAQTADNKFLTSEDVIELELRHDLQQKHRLGGKFATVEDSYRSALLERFLSYTKVDSQSQLDDTMEFPMNDNLRRTAALLYQEIQLFAKPAGWKTYLSENQYIYIHIPSNIKKKVPVLGFSAHYDTTPDIPGSGIKARVIKNYDGGDVVINQEKNIVINPQNEPYLGKMIGQTIVVSDGNTMLSADDKAGVATVVTALQTLAENPNIKHGPIQVVITPNEDIGMAGEGLDLDLYYPEIPFDFDAGVNGEVIVANFSAYGALVKIHGIHGHQSYAATNGYRNATIAAAAVIKDMAQLEDLPNYSTGEDGYIEPHHTTYDAQNNIVTVDFRLRFFDPKQGEAWFRRLDKAVAAAAQKYDVKIEKQVVKQYTNVADGMHPAAQQLVGKALQAAGVEPKFLKERAGTGPAMFAKRDICLGAPCLPTGQNNPHSFKEWLSEKDLFISYKAALNLVKFVQDVPSIPQRAQKTQQRAQAAKAKLLNALKNDQKVQGIIKGK